MEYIQNLSTSILRHKDNNAFFINGNYFTYNDFAKSISAIRQLIAGNIPDNEKLVGLVTNDDLETYASIIALWLEGKAYVPVNPETPPERNSEILQLVEAIYIIDSSETSLFSNYNVLKTKGTAKTQINLLPKQNIHADSLAYILFTSGSTGTPKGVPITFNNVQALSDAVNAESTFNLTPQDRCLQMFELTFDFSVVTYLFPILAGACMYTIPKRSIKYFYIFKLIKDKKLTVLTMVPSIIHYLRPYFSEINEPSVRYCSFGGGALHTDIAKEWSDCLPNCKIFNYYGPTEFTVYSGFYPYNKHTNTKSHNGIIAIGTPQKNTKYLVVDENNLEVAVGITGELCLAGPQITPGYWKDEKRNQKSFFIHQERGHAIRYYKTGDLCIKDTDNDFLYVGRKDFQVKIRGYRVELSEIEHHIKVICEEKVGIVAIDIYNKLDNAEIGLAIESKPFNTEYIMEYLKTKLPGYMMPTHVEFIPEFPHNINGKIDRNALRTLFKTNEP